MATSCGGVSRAGRGEEGVARQASHTSRSCRRRMSRSDFECPAVWCARMISTSRRVVDSGACGGRALLRAPLADHMEIRTPCGARVLDVRRDAPARTEVTSAVTCSRWQPWRTPRRFADNFSTRSSRRVELASSRRLPSCGSRTRTIAASSIGGALRSGRGTYRGAIMGPRSISPCTVSSTISRCCFSRVLAHCANDSTPRRSWRSAGGGRSRTRTRTGRRRRSSTIFSGRTRHRVATTMNVRTRPRADLSPALAHARRGSCLRLCLAFPQLRPSPPRSGADPASRRALAQATSRTVRKADGPANLVVVDRQK